MSFTGGNWRDYIEDGNWELETGSWKLAIAESNVAAGISPGEAAGRNQFPVSEFS